jgi:hypothetical protein
MLDFPYILVNGSFREPITKKSGLNPKDRTPIKVNSSEMR